MHTTHRPPLGRFSLAKMLCTVFLFCAAMAIASPGQTLTTLHSFDGDDGSGPIAGLVQGSDGNFYGTTQGGGINCGYYSGCGTVFKITPRGALTTLYKFCSQTNCVDGALPEGGLIQAVDGDFYGTTSYGGTGSGGNGTIFKITPSGTLTTLYSFCSQPNCADGGRPYAGLVQATDGNFYGSTNVGGSGGGTYDGTLFKITPDGKLTTLYNFCSQASCADGQGPYDALVQATDGNFYGTTSYGGGSSQCRDGCGTVFKITPSGTLTTLHNFTGYPSDGAYPYAGFVQATDGNFYGATAWGGASGNCSAPYANGCGTVFKITPGGTLTTLHSFDTTDGNSPEAGLVQATDGNLYGTAFGAPSYGGGSPGTIFQITLGGTLKTLYSFCPQKTSCPDGLGPWAGLVQAADGNLYGTALLGGTGNCPPQGCGTVFKLSGPSPSPIQFVPVTPCRLVDTRQTGNPIQGGTFQFFVVPQLGGCNIPTTAAAYSLNVTVVPHGFLGYLTVWPAGHSQPLASTLNSYDGRVKANAAIVQAGANSAISVYAYNTTDLILDIDGYFAPVSSSTLAFYPLAPCRVADTRGAPGDLGGPFLKGGVNRDFPVLEATSCNIPSSAQAYSLNFTAVPHGSLGYLTVCPTPSDPSQNCPVISTLNSYGGQVTANAAIVPAGVDGKIRTFPYNDTDLIIDINGYFAPPGMGGLSLYPVTPCRVLDTRPPSGSGPFQFELNPPVDVLGSVCGPPSQSQAYVFNATVVPQGPLDYLALWPYGSSQPVVSTLNAYDGAITSNMAIVPAGTGGKVNAYANPVNPKDPTDLTNLILDISSYFAP